MSRHPRRHPLELRIPPPLVGLVLAVAGWAAAPLGPVMAELAGPRRLLALALLAAGLGVELSGVWAFARARTTVNPLRPERARALVTGGVYRITRNPMYLGMVLLLLAWAVQLGAALALLAPPLFIAYIGRFQIRPEEQRLQALFGDAYRAYCARVRRWL